MRNIFLSRYDVQPSFDAFEAYLDTQAAWEQLIHLVRKKRYAVRCVLETHNLSSPAIHRDENHRRQLTREELLEVLLKLPAFSAFSGKERQILLDYCHVKTYYEHETVFACGDYDDEVCLVLKGEVQLMANREENSSAAPMEIASIRAGGFLGENCLSQNVFRLSGTAVEFTELLCIGRYRLKMLLEAHPTIGVKLLSCFLQSLSEKITRSNEVRLHTADYLGYNHEIRSDVEIPAPRLCDNPPCGRVNVKERPASERKRDFDCVECPLTGEEIAQESGRCLRCDHFGYGVFKGGRETKW